MTEKTEIKLSKEKIIDNLKRIALSSIISFILLLIIALFGSVRFSNSNNKYSSDVCYYGILSQDGYCNIDNVDPGNSIKFYYGYTFDGPDVPNEKKVWYQPKEDERWSIPKTFFTSEKNVSDITFIDKFLVIYLPLILSKSILIWVVLSIIIYYTFKLKNKYKFKLE